MNEAFDLDWGDISPDGYNREANKALYVYNVSFLSEEAREKAMELVVGKALWHRRHLPAGCGFQFHLDLRGQDEISDQAEMHNAWRDEVLQRIRAQVPGVEVEMNITT